MAQIWNPKDPELLKHWLDSILEEASNELNDWETNFISDIEVKLNNNWRLTENQENKLEQIYAEKTS